jgi:hypothetical protein
MNKDLFNLIAEEAKRLDEITLQAGDVLDVKASIVLLAVTFLGTLSGQIVLVNDLPAPVKILQIVSIFGLCSAGILTIASLWPRDFRVPRDPGELAKYAEGLIAFYNRQANPNDLALVKYEQERMARFQYRISENEKLTSRKAKLNRWAFYSVAVSLLTELPSLLWLAFWHMHL